MYSALEKKHPSWAFLGMLQNKICKYAILVNLPTIYNPIIMNTYTTTNNWYYMYIDLHVNMKQIWFRLLQHVNLWTQCKTNKNETWLMSYLYFLHFVYIFIIDM